MTSYQRQLILIMLFIDIYLLTCLHYNYIYSNYTRSISYFYILIHFMIFISIKFNLLSQYFIHFDNLFYMYFILSLFIPERCMIIMDILLGIYLLVSWKVNKGKCIILGSSNTYYKENPHDKSNKQYKIILVYIYILGRLTRIYKN